ncbi:exported hypothetical protein [Vibrio nigripulchritudo SFn27]|uniref:hypothetical protein n=1 Tax=Vibrio nigripulchritudo TaxID=28173 RepID=UPI0003B24186|nr:hypothetical protein [Vibrio nigripulchritudo]CCN86044.1 exported hypothetical protein [Vibrio nigripulchritudo BLFn1]CCN92031.1 exported hypothetical protein [Vibrio nigripulchritudo SFn27]CCN97842.1 exported hypothetical protein [Vibrio nigripulchritudo ENn2]CCO44065.1 exported hypothetical protein [Vibrio nigripulchritudo SFn135]CCO56153.1 exported hypothetical protein [Vibrio nigripulchritudo Wn13]
MNHKAFALIAFLYVTGLSSAALYSSIIGDTVEKSIGFASSMTTYVVVAILFARFSGIDIICKKKREGVALAFLSLTAIEYLYPVFEYSEQSFGSTHYSMLLVELFANAIISKILIEA